MIYADRLNAQISIGAMDEKITLKVKTGYTYDDLGEIIGRTTTNTEMWAHVADDIDNETDIEHRQTVMDFKDFTCRYKPCFVEDQIEYDGDIYDIIRLETMGRKRYMKLRGKIVK
jgi:SPP1 family predicted phage head-tail adaptor